jgi:hypothetical protein
MNTIYKEALIQLINHLKLAGTVEDTIYESTLEMIKNKQGSLHGCLTVLISRFDAKTSFHWLLDKNMYLVKKNAYISSRLRQISDSVFEKNATEHPIYTHGYNLTLSDCWFYLLSDHPTLSVYGAKKMQQLRLQKSPQDNPKNLAYALGILPHAILGEFNILAQKARAQLSIESKNLIKFRPINEFYIALSCGDLVGMNTAIQTLVSTKSIGALSGTNCGFTGIHLNYTAPNSTTVLSLWATVLAKIAYRYSYELDIDSPYVPKELLPMQPLTEYKDPFDFMLEYPLPT